MIPRTSNSNITELSYYSRLAIACAVAGKFDDGGRYIQKAIMSSYFLGCCVAIPNFLYIYVFFLLCVYEQNPSKENRKHIIRISEMGLQSVEDENELISRFWVRIFMLRMIYALLGLSFKGEPITAIYVEPRCISRAKKLLSEVDSLWDTIESRRKIMYFVAKARISQLEEKADYIKTVLYYLNIAISIGEEIYQEI